MSRPTRYTNTLFNEICQHIIKGNSLRSICRQKGYPALSTLMYWLSNNPELQRRYSLAQAVRTHLMYEELIEIADDESIDIKQAKLMIDARKWMINRLEPKKYVTVDYCDSDRLPIFMAITRRII